MRAFACVALAVAALAGCAMESDETLARRACYGVEPWQAYNSCYLSMRRQQREEDMANQAIAATLLTGGGAFPKTTTTCFRTGMVTQCQ